MPEPLPERIGRYPITRVLGEGGMGIVFLGRDPGTDRDVAIKTIKANLSEDIKQSIRPRFEREGKAGRLQHPNIVTVYETGEWGDGRPYIAMEYIDGPPLDKLMAELKESGRRLPLSERLDIVRQLCEGLDYAHQNGVFHRDISPDNVMRQKDGQVKIVDFGIARVQHTSAVTSLTAPLQIIGKVEYMAPERIRGDRGDGPGDIWAAGVILYYLLTDQKPFTGAETMTIAHKVVSEPYAPLSTHLPDYPPAIDSILELALAKDPRDRYSRAQEFAADLAAVINDINRERIPGLLRDAERLLAERRWDLASEKADEAGRIDPQNVKARELSRKASRGKRDEAEEEKIQADLREAQSSMAYGRYEQAIAFLEELVRRRPGNVEFQTLLEEAKSKRRNQNQKEAKRAEALSLLEMGDRTGAIHRYEELLVLDPADQQLHEEYLRLKKDFEEQAERARTERHIENARQAVGAQRYTEAIAILEGIVKSKIARPEVDKLLQEALKGRKDKEDALYREQVAMQARKLRSVEQYAEALAEIDAGLARLPGDTGLLRLKGEIDREAKNTQLKGWIAETVERVLVKALSAPDEALIELRQAKKELPGEERFELLEADLLKRIEDAEAQRRRSECLRAGGEALYAGDPGRAVQIVQRYLLKDRSDDEIDRLLNEAQAALNERELERRVAECDAKAQPLLEQGRFTEAIGIIQPELAETRSKRLERLLELAERRKKEIDAAVRLLAPRILELRQAGRQGEAIALIESQDAITLRNPDLQRVLEVLREELKRDTALAEAAARSRHAIEAGQWAAAREPLDDIRRVFGEFDGLTRALAEFESFRAGAADALVTKSIEAAKSSTLAGDKAAARKALEGTKELTRFATPAVVQDWERLAKELKIDPGPEPGVAPPPPSKFPSWAIGIAAIAVIAVVILIWSPWKTSDASVVVNFDPSEATVLVNGYAPQKTDQSGKATLKVKPGDYTLTVSKAGYKEYSRTFKAVAGGANDFSGILTNMSTAGYLVVDSGEVQKFEVFVGKDSLGIKNKGERIEITPGSPEIHYAADGYEPSKGKQILITKGQDSPDTWTPVRLSTAPRIDSFRVSQTSVEPNGQVKLQWSATNVQKVSLEAVENGRSRTFGDFKAADSTTVPLTVDTKFRLIATGNDNTTIKSEERPVRVALPGTPTILTFDPNKETVNAGDTVEFSWTANNDTAGVKIDPATTGGHGANGSGVYTVPEKATAPITFSITPAGKGGAMGTPVTRIVKVIPKAAPLPSIIAFSSSKGSVKAGESIDLQWSTKDTASVFINGLEVNDHGTQKFPVEGTTTFELIARNSDMKVATSKVVVTVTAPPPQPNDGGNVSTVEKSVLESAVGSFGSRITGALYTKDEKGCKAALSSLSGMVSPDLKVPLEALGRRCGDVKTVTVAPLSCGAPKAEGLDRATMLCAFSFPLTPKSGDTVGNKYADSNFVFAKSASGVWEVKKWEWQRH